MTKLRLLFLPFVIILAFIALMFLALCGLVYELSRVVLCFFSFHKWKYAVDSQSKLRDKFEEDCFFRECQRPRCTVTEERDDYHHGERPTKRDVKYLEKFADGMDKK